MGGPSLLFTHPITPHCLNLSSQGLVPSLVLLGEGSHLWLLQPSLIALS